MIIVTGYMAYVGASSSWKYYVTADECLADMTRFEGVRVHVSGGVAPGTLRISPEGNRASFSLLGQTGTLEVRYEGPLPDNLAQAMDVVVEGRCESGGTIRADKVLTRCASKYEPERTKAVRTGGGSASASEAVAKETP